MTTINQKIATQIIQYVAKNKKMPKIITIDKLGYNQNQMAYRLAYSITHKLKDSKNFHIDNPKNPIGNKWNSKVKKAAYLDLAKRYVTYVEKNRQTPNYASLNGKKVAIILLIYEFARIVNSFHANKKLPDTCTFDSAHVRGTTTEAEKKAKYAKKKYGRSTQTGCDNRGQNNGYYCGPHMVQEIIRNLTGKVIPQSTLAGIIGTTSSGSSHSGIDTCFAWFNRNFNFELEIEWKNFGDIGWNGIKKILESQNQDCGLHELYRDEWGHYTNFDKVYDNSIDVHNSLGNYCTSNCYCGYTENRNKADAKRYLNGISQKSVLIVTRVK